MRQKLIGYGDAPLNRLSVGMTAAGQGKFSPQIASLPGRYFIIILAIILKT